MFEFNQQDTTTYQAMINVFQMEEPSEHKAREPTVDHVKQKPSEGLSPLNTEEGNGDSNSGIRVGAQADTKPTETKPEAKPEATKPETKPEAKPDTKPSSMDSRPVVPAQLLSQVRDREEKDLPDTVRNAKFKPRPNSPSGAVGTPGGGTPPATPPTHTRRKSTPSHREYDPSTMGQPPPPPVEPAGHNRRKSGVAKRDVPKVATATPPSSTRTTGWSAAKEALSSDSHAPKLLDVVNAATANKELLDYTPTPTAILPEPAEMLKSAMTVFAEDNRTRPQRLMVACETMRSILAHHTFVPQPEPGTGPQYAAYEHWKKRLEMIGSEGEVVLRPNTPELDELVSNLQSQLGAARDPAAFYALYGVFQMLFTQLGSELDKSLVAMVPLLVRTLADRPYPPLIKALIENTSRVRVLRFLFVLAKDKLWKVKVTAGQCIKLSIEQLGPSALHPLCLGDILDSCQRLMGDKEEPCRATGERMMYAMAKVVEGNKDLTKTLADSIAVTMSGPRDLLTNALKKGSSLAKQEAKLKAQQEKPAYSFEELKKDCIDGKAEDQATDKPDKLEKLEEQPEEENAAVAAEEALTDAQHATNALDNLLDGVAE